MSLVIGALPVAAFVLGLRLGARILASPSLQKPWHDEVVFLVVTPGLTACLAFGVALIAEHVVTAAFITSELVPVIAAIAVLVATVVGWRMIGTTKPVSLLAPAAGGNPDSIAEEIHRKAA